ILTLFTYGTILWGLSGVISIPLGHSNSISIPGYLLWLCIGFSMITNYTVYLVGKRLVPLEYEQQHYEADFRATLMKMRENSEVIALARGEDNEIETAMGGFDLIVKNFRAIISKFIHLEIFHEANARGKKICVSLAAAPRIFSGAMSVGDFTQALGSFQYLADCIALLSDQFQTFADWRSATRRLADFEESLSRASIVQHELQERPTLNSLDGVAAVDLELQTPDARQLIDRICLEIREGERVLFKGRSGTGKSTLFRVLAGIWPFYSGRVKQPERTQTTFLSQVPYLPQGTLRQVILYPIPKTPVSSEDIVKKLNQFGLVNLVEKLDVKEDWQKVLSPGEQQRLVLIRAIFQKPKWLFLDEATTALDQQNQTLAYQILTDELKESSIVSISHQNELAKFHQRTVDLDSVDRDTIKKIS
ncbi:MAG: ABC transporter ATP-binding protein/permease, partial [Bdellovibrionales bacterium]